ncbi:MAG: hypothetical protein GFH27_549319n129 [Chloroflexi bacterium AL-W]|nr:hypothetical protein [Chloroflexi bacterium AL-N1]NOK71292.1 hypothetical protein [Chloroflexi bacterium AL-N10]NOK77667.1 hypothetical protein [Chloroflexi bacterium AL-N5]NOK84518.1 hypothetical protein [Chloroflexi bacterium AL-W]NOK92969.1 hypothetical protein [Chloroflexi bacterium AL-N15]
MDGTIARTSVRLRPIALPTEHGGWGFLLEPIVLGLLIAPTVAGMFLGLAAINVFLFRHPLELMIADLRRGKRYPRTFWVCLFVLLYGGAALCAFVIALWFASAPFWMAVLVAVPLATIHILYNLCKQARHLIPEIAGASALSGSIAAITLVAGWGMVAAFALWAVLIIRAVTAIVYVRTRIRHIRGVTVSTQPTWLAHSVGFFLILGLTWLQTIPWTATLAFGILLIRAVYGVSPRRTSTRVAVVGIQELAFGVLTMLLLALGYIL